MIGPYQYVLATAPVAEGSDFLGLKKVGLLNGSRLFNFKEIGLLWEVLNTSN